MAAGKKPKSTKSTPKPKYQYDAVVIGTGPGGEGVAMQLSKAGKSVAVVEKHHTVGGGCTHWGTIPSKALRHSVSRLIEYNNNPLFSDSYKGHHLTFKQILKHASGVIRKQAHLRGSFYERNRVTIYNAEASFIDKHTINLLHPDGSEETITTQHGGDRHWLPPLYPFRH